jgi:V/A-type H+-transporting ATPase subunit E
VSEKNAVIAITDKIQAEARAWADEQIAAAKAEAKAILADHQARADQAYDNTLAEAKVKAAFIADRAVSQAEVDRRKMLLSTRQECVAQAFDKALEMLCNMSVQERVLLMVKSAVQYQTADAEYIFNAADRKEVGPLVVDTVNAIFKKQQLRETFSGDFLEQVKKLLSGARTRALTATLSEQTGDFAGGFILKQGNIEFNCTFEVLIAGVRENLEGETSAILFS